MADDKILALYEKGSYEVKPHDGMRRIIAQRLTQSKQTVPHFYLSLDCRLDTLLAARERINAAAPKDGPRAYKLSVNDFVIKALALALQQVPAANATWTEAGMLRHRHSDVGVAVAIEGGLFTPVIRHAELKTLGEISNEMKDLAERARKRRLAPHEYQGGTTSISNLGMFGIKSFDAVINPPHATILAVGAGEKRPVVVGDKVRGRHDHELHAVVRSPRRRRCARRRVAQRLPVADRGSRAHAGLRPANRAALTPGLARSTEDGVLGIGMAMICGGIAWVLAFKRLVKATDVDPFGLTIWSVRAALIGAVLIGCLAVARYLTDRPGRGLKIGLAQFLLASLVLLVFFCAVSYMCLGGNLADATAFTAFGKTVAQAYGNPALIALAAFLSCELLMARL